LAAAATEKSTTMRIDEYLQTGLSSFSFEFMPPRSDEEVAILEKTVAELRPLKPAFVNVTHGAGGASRSLTLDLCTRIKAETGIETMAHVTCAGYTYDELIAILERLRDAGIENVLAIRGDPPLGQGLFEPAPGGLRFGSELIRLIRDHGFDFCIGAAVHPEGHPESFDRHEDLRHAKEKVDAGASFLITQLFFDSTFYFDLVERARNIGIEVPIIPGIMPVTRIGQVRRFVEHHGVTIPARLLNALERCETPRETRELGIAWATEQCRELLERGAPGVHFYTFNRSLATRRVMHAIGNYPD